MTIRREPAGRLSSQIRPLQIETGVTRYAEGSVIIRAGHTHVLCNASVEETVPNWLAGRGRGWITAEYSMLPRSTHTRSKRDREKISGRTYEIQRLIGRALRAMVKLENLGERSIIVDCDVLQADGGTRTASITGGCIALALAIGKLHQEGKFPEKPLREILVDTVAAVSVGIKNSEVLVDPDYGEDSTCDVDMNFVIMGSGAFVEIQGTAERQAFSRADLNRMTDSAVAAVEQIRQAQLRTLAEAGIRL